MTDITFNGKQYNSEEISEKARYFVGQLNYIQEEIFKLRSKIDRLELANEAFNKFLTDELEGEDEKEEGA